METLLKNHYTHALWNLFLANNTARSVNQQLSLQDTLQEFWTTNQNANVPAKDLPAATLQNLYELAHSDDEDALTSVKAGL